jgi:hypothetical protein
MTAKRDLKRRVRARQKQTGERYTTALAAVRSQDKPKTDSAVSEFYDATALAREAGLVGRVLASPGLSELDPAARAARLRGALLRLRELLAATGGDAAFVPLRAALLEGEPRAEWRWSWERLAALRTFLGRLRLGLSGPSEDGSALAFPVEGGELLLAALLPGATRSGSGVILALAGEALRLADRFAGAYALGPGMLPFGLLYGF